MPSVANFKEIESIFQKALDEPSGNIRIDCGSHGAAVNLRQRLNNWRVLARKENKEMYPADNPLWGACVYDNLSMRVPPSYAPDSRFIYITRRKPLEFSIEVLPGPDSSGTDSSGS